MCCRPLPHMQQAQLRAVQVRQQLPERPGCRAKCVITYLRRHTANVLCCPLLCRCCRADVARRHRHVAVLAGSLSLACFMLLVQVSWYCQHCLSHDAFWSPHSAARCLGARPLHGCMAQAPLTFVLPHLQRSHGLVSDQAILWCSILSQVRWAAVRSGASCQVVATLACLPGSQRAAAAAPWR